MENLPAPISPLPPSPESYHDILNFEPESPIEITPEKVPDVEDPTPEVITPKKNILPKEQRFSNEKRNYQEEGNCSKNINYPKRIKNHSVPQFYQHDNVTGVLCIKGNSYSLTNGVHSISLDDNPFWKVELGNHLNQLRIGRLYVTDLDTKLRLKQVSKKEVTLLSSLGPMGKCMFCHKEACCRWIVVFAYQILFKTKLEAIRH